MKLSNKVRYYLGLKAIATHQGKFLITRRFFPFCREFYDQSDCAWWSKPYSGSYFNTLEEAQKHRDLQVLKPV